MAAMGIAFALGVAVTFVLQPKPVPSLSQVIPSDEATSYTPEIVPVQVKAQDALTPINTESNTPVQPVTLPPTEMQLALYDQLLGYLSDPAYIKSHTLQELMQLAEALTAIQREQFYAIGKAMFANGELKLEDFRSLTLAERAPPRYKLVAEGAPQPSPAEQVQFEQVSIDLYDADYQKSLTFENLGAAVQELPPSLRQELADRLNAMLASGELSPRQFYEAAGQSIPASIPDDQIPLQFYFH